MFSKTPRVVALVTLLAPCPLLGQQPITDANWRNHPAIVTVRRMVLAIDSAALHGKLRQRTDSAVCEGGRVRLAAHLFTDSAGHVRKYVLVGGSDDAAGDATYYYDASGTLRFIFARTNAVNGTEREDRTYFDAAGSQLYANSQLPRGPGYPGGFGDPIRNADEDFHSLCG